MEKSHFPPSEAHFNMKQVERLRTTLSRTADRAAVALRCWHFKKKRMLHVNIYFLRMQMRGVIACTVLSDVERPAADVCIEMRWPICVGIATGSRVSLSMTLPAHLTHSLSFLSVCLPHSHSSALVLLCYHGRSPPPVWLNLDESGFQDFNLFKWVNNIAIKMFTS